MRRHLDEACRLRQVDRGVADLATRLQYLKFVSRRFSYLGQEDSVDLRTVLEVLQDPHALNLRRAAMNKEFPQLVCVLL